MTGFSNPIVGGGGALVYPSIHSPGFSAGPPIVGWSIDKNGDVFLSGSFSGNNWELNASGAFFYSGTPALGNLILSNVGNPAGVTDDHGNHALGGLAVYSGGVAEQIIDGEHLWYTGSLSAGWTQVVGTFIELNSITGSLEVFGAPLLALGAQVIIGGGSTPTAIASDSLEIQGTALATVIAAIVGGAAETWHQITSGFPAGYTGIPGISYRKLPTGTLAGGASDVMLDWAIQIASGTVVNAGAVMGTLPAGYYYASDNKEIGGTLTGGGLATATYAPATVSDSPAGAFKYAGPSFTPSANAFWYGQAIITTAV